MNIAICYDETMIRRHLALAEEGGGIPGFLDTYGSAGELLATRKAYDLVLIDGRTLRDMQRRSTGMGRRKDRRGTEDGFFRVLSHGQEIKIRCQEILYAENDLKKIILHTEGKTIEYVGAMRELEKELGETFFRCHRGYLVNMVHVSSYHADTVVMDNGDALYLSRRKYAEFDALYRKIFC